MLATISAFFTTALLILTLTGCKQFGTHLEVPTPAPDRYTSLRILALHPVSIQEAFICGNLLLPDGSPEGLIMRSEDGGKSWTRMGFEVHDLTRVSFQTIYYTDRLRGWVGGIRITPDGRTLPFVFRTEDGGNHWREHPLLMDQSNLVTEIHSLSFTADETGTVIVQSTDPETFKLTETWYGTTDGGETWEVLDEKFRTDPLPRLEEPSLVMVDKKHGFRLSPGPHTGQLALSSSMDCLRRDPRSRSYSQIPRQSS